MIQPQVPWPQVQYRDTAAGRTVVSAAVPDSPDAVNFARRKAKSLKKLKSLETLKSLKKLKSLKIRVHEKS